MNTKPDTYAIEATEAQVAWLNRLSDLSGQYWTNLRYLKKWTEDALETGNVTTVDHQTFSKVQSLNGAIGEMMMAKNYVFPQADLPEEEEARRERVAQIVEWVKLAREHNPNGLMGIHWFFKKES